MIVKLLTDHQFLSFKGGAQARLSLHMSKWHIVGNHMSWLIYPLQSCTQEYQNLALA